MKMSEENRADLGFESFSYLNPPGDNSDLLRAMAEGNGEVTIKNENSATDDDSVEKTEDYPKLIAYGLDVKVASKLDEIYRSGKLAHADLDERALDALKEFPVEGAVNVLTQFLESNLEHVSNKSAYLCGVMKTYRQKSRGGGTAGPGSAGNTTPASTPAKGPDEDKIKAILERTGYTLDVTTGQRKYGGPPPNWDGPPPGPGCEVFCGKIPKDMFEDELILLFEKSGKIWDLRLMMDPMTGTNRGYAFITYTTKEEAQQATKDLDNHEIKPGKHLKVNISVPNLRLFVGNIPKSKGKEEIMEEFSKLTAGLTEVIIYSSPDDKKKNRGFCFLEYESHKAASLAKRRLGTGRVKVWGCDIIVDWADPQEEPDSETMAKVKVLYVRNLTQECSEEKLKEAFEVFGKVDRVKKIKDYAFIHFDERDHAVNAMDELNGKDMGGSSIEVSLAKPPSDKKKKEEILRARERRMMQMMQLRGGGFSPQHPSMMAPLPRGGPMPRGSSSTMRSMGRGDYDYDYDYYGYGDYRGGYSDPYYDDYYRYEDYYYDYTPAIPPARGRARQPQPGGRGRGTVGRGRAGGPQGRGVGALGVSSNTSRVQQPQRGAGTQGAPHRGHPHNHQPARGSQRAKQSLPGKRKLDGGNQNQGETKRRYQSSWGNQPLAQQPLGNTYGMNGGAYSSTGDQQWYQDSYGSWS
ncbi:heterogeneous nuclear ribonucleoprotein Q isoform X3 [Cimex lectularius]|uniref:RRM domain-containing protein n=1 Tax=Cimex lectularius TaxID=79782 RepID=A0A8I6SQ46_CIMLE|nr:heterogeneous nuclear ribonucleoprotein Q isoform X3 [Cimex lectularius]